jgi:N-acetylmuramoyl-L-alanine amidase
MPRAVINFGHGPKNIGYDPGAIGPTGYQDATQNKEVGTLVVDKLLKNGWEILAIQDGDLWDVTNQSDAWKPDIFLSIHGNSFPDLNAKGIESIAISPGGKGEKVAREVQKELISATGLTDRGVKFSNLHVLRETDCPAVLVEVGFISNPNEEALMKQASFDETVASAICRGLSRAMGVIYTEPTKVPPTTLPVTSDKDIYLSVRVLQSKADQAILDINKLGFATKKLELA